MGREKRRIGKIGEEMAVTFLKQKGYQILETNARTHFGEIDIVARQEDATVFVEVKTRATSSLGPPLLSVTRLKQQHMVRNALCYLKRRGRVYSDWRIDVVSVKLNDACRLETIELIKNAVEEY